jgi:hypothetical protein
LEYLSNNLGWFVGAFIVSLVILVFTFITYSASAFASVTEKESRWNGCGVIVSFILFSLSWLSVGLSFVLIVASLIARLIS